MTLAAFPFGASTVAVHLVTIPPEPHTIRRLNTGQRVVVVGSLVPLALDRWLASPTYEAEPMIPPDCCDDHCPKCCVYCADATAATPSTTHPTGRCDDRHCPHCRKDLRSGPSAPLVVSGESPATAPNRAARRLAAAIARKGGKPKTAPTPAGHVAAAVRANVARTGAGRRSGRGGDR